MPVEEMHSSAPVIEVIHGETVADPYRWLEDRGLPETESWIRKQRTRCDDYFSNCPALESIRERVRSYLDVDVLDQPSRVGERYFYRRRNRGEEQACIYVRDIASGQEHLLIDPSAEGTFSSVSIYRISDDGSLLAFERRLGGEDKSAVGFVDVNRACILDDTIENGYARGLVLRPEEGGFYYCHDDRENAGEHTVRFRRFGEAGAGPVVFRANRTRESRLVLTADTVHLGIIWIHERCSALLSDFLIAPLSGDPQWVSVFSEHDPSFQPFLHKGRIFARHAAENRNGCISEFSSDGRKIRTVISAGALPIRQISVADDRFYTNQYDHRTSLVSCWSLDGKHLGTVDVPEDGSVALVPHQSVSERSLFYAFESFDQPPILFEYGSTADKSLVFHRRTLREQTTRATVTRFVFSGKDGTEVPLTLVGRGTAPSDREAPLVLTVYGGFGAPMTPQFSVLATILMERGAQLAIAHVRGGGEFGDDWHDAGSKRNRQTGIDDLLSAAESLCSRGITTPRQLGLFGGSNAGLMVAAAIMQRPALFGAALSIAPLLDMVRYEHFDRAVRWRSEYGTVDEPEEFRALLSYSPYHRIEESVNYPPTMFVVGDRDDRCNPAHVRKAAARMQERPAQTSPVVVDYCEERGHMPTMPLSVRVEALARRIAFLSRELNIAPTGGHREAICH